MLDYHTTDVSIAIRGISANLVRRTDGKPMRAVSTGAKHRPIGDYYSMKNGDSLGWESRNELHSFYHSEINPNITGYHEQPHTLEIVIDGKLRKYTPDRHDIYVEGQIEIVEVKDVFEEEADPDYTRKLALAAEIYRNIGWKFRIEERSQIEAQPAFSNVEHIQAYRRTVVTAEDTMLIFDTFKGVKTLELSSVLSAFRNAPTGFAKLAAMMVRRIVAIDLSRPIGPKSSVRIVSAKGGL